MGSGKYLGSLQISGVITLAVALGTLYNKSFITDTLPLPLFLFRSLSLCLSMSLSLSLSLPLSYIYICIWRSRWDVPDSVARDSKQKQMTTRVLTICISIERYTRILVSQHKLTDHQHDPKVRLSEKLYTSESRNHSSSSRSSSSSNTHASTAILIRH